jgi:predicted nucleic acid-binding Zn finger protein
MLIEQQIAERQDRAAAAPLKILKRPADGPYGDYSVKSASGRTYKVAIRGLGLFENYCSCPDFAVNTLGTCKHVEAMLLRLRKRHQKTLEAAKFKRRVLPFRLCTGMRSKCGYACRLRLRLRS